MSYPLTEAEEVHRDLWVPTNPIALRYIKKKKKKDLKVVR